MTFVKAKWTFIKNGLIHREVLRIFCSLCIAFKTKTEQKQKMKTIQLIVFFSLVFCLNGFSQTKLPLEFRVEKQAMSTPMSPIDEAFFMNYYYSKPVNVKFDGTVLNMTFDNGATFLKKEVVEVSRDKEVENGRVVLETIMFVDKTNSEETLCLVIDRAVGYVQLILPTTNQKGEYVGYTSYRQFVKEEQLAYN